LEVASEVRVRISKKYTLYIPRDIANAVGIKEGSLVKLRVEGCKVVMEPIPDPFDLALEGPKFAKITFEDFERESERAQAELFGET